MLGSQTPDGFIRPQEKGSILLPTSHILAQADITLGNLEGTLCDSGETQKCEPDSLDCYVFRMPEQYLDDLVGAGFDMLSLANNHVGDFGSECMKRTEDLLDGAGIGWSGRAGSYTSRMVGDIRVGFIAYHSGGASNWSLHLPSAYRMIRKLADSHDILIVSLHGGGEGLLAMHLPDTMETYLGEQRGELKKFSRMAIDAGADLVIGHGPHIARAMEIYKDRMIAYSMGNYATYGRFNLQAERRFGGILEVGLSPQGRVLSARIISTEQKYWGVPFIDPLHRFSSLVDSLSQADIRTQAARFSSTGTLINP